MKRDKYTCQSCGASMVQTDEENLLCFTCYKRYRDYNGFLAHHDEWNTLIEMEEIREYHGYRNELIRKLKING